VRGFITPCNNKLLVLIDGRSVYTDFYGDVSWDLFPIGLEEIDRIEVVKSPASSIYGANAYSGVIHIITKSPEQLQGTTLKLTAGNRNTLIGSILHAGLLGRKTIRYKVSTEFDRTNAWGENEVDENAGDITRVNARLEYVPDEKTKLFLAGGRTHSREQTMFTLEGGGTSKVRNTIDYLQAGIKVANLELRVFLKSEQPEQELFLIGAPVSWDAGTYDAELLHSFRIGTNHSLIWGINYRLNTLEKNILVPQDHQQHLWALFLEDEVKLSDKLRLTLGGRYDRHPLVGEHFSPRGNIFYSPAKKHMIRFSFSRAFLNPSFFISYADYTHLLYTTLDMPPLHLEIPFTFNFRGNQNLDSQIIDAYEIGYHALLNSNLKLSLNLFSHRYTHFISTTNIVTFYDANEIFPGSPPGVLPKTLQVSFGNRGEARGIGGELNLDFSFNNRISGFFNYSYQQITDKQDDPNTWVIDEKDRIRGEYPKHKCNAGLRIIFKNGISINLLAHWVDKTNRLIFDYNVGHHLSPLRDYFMFNTRLGYTFRKGKVELALSVFNLFNDNHWEYPAGIGLDLHNSERIGRRITFNVRIKL